MDRHALSAERAPCVGPSPLVQLHFRLVATWRCPHCDTPQSDGARCWACSRHPLACGSCRHYIRAVAGRLGYCALDRTRAVLQGDEIRACWQAPSRAEPLEGLFQGLDAGDTSPDGDLVGTRTWAIPVRPDVPPPITGGMSGLRDATHVPARTASHSRSAGAGSTGSGDLEPRRVLEDRPVGEGDPDADEARTHGRALGDTHP